MITIGFEKGARSALIGVLGQDDQAPILSSPVGALSFIGENSLLVAASRDLNRFWTHTKFQKLWHTYRKDD
ncbi:MAG: hypothetical protein DWQ54_10895 [Microcystis flos-aquae TF09]|uniref:Uncharacterized protein n=1 Tax=Microcystis flos-aquae TF09 TaxID=2060473 RepID=A0A3E0L7D9_9CHRO|nr:MAG: hypothetical protein DWQ54_10895 [Microcystis flos-aquae TF09]